MAIDFPASPSNGQTFTSGTVTYTYDGSKWTAVAADNSGIFIANTATAGSPSLTFVGDTNTGIYSPGADQVGISTNGVGRLFIDASGNVGVGASPSARFEVSTTAGTEARITSTVDNNADLTFYTNGVMRGIVEGNSLGLVLGTIGSLPTTFVTNNTERLRLTADGKLGLGTSSASSRLHVYGSESTLANIQSTGASSYFLLGNSNNNLGYIGYEGTNFNFYPNNTANALVVTPTGVGIGTSLPDVELHVHSTSQNPAVQITRGAVGSEYGYALYGADGATSAALRFFTVENGAGTGEKMRIDSQGRVGIGTTSPTTPLSVRAVSNITTYGNVSANFSDNTTGTLYVQHSSGKVQLGSDAALAFGYGVSATEGARLDSSGRFLVGTSSTVDSSSTALLQVSTASGADFGIGNSTTVGAGAAKLGQIGFYGFQGSYALAASITANADATWSSNDYPSRLVFSTTADGASSPTSRVVINSAGTLYPGSDNSYFLGVGSNRWAAVYAANGTIQTSDQRAKTEINDASLGSNFIKSLRPVSYKWIEGGRQETLERDENNEARFESIPGERTHWGFVAQEVKQAVDAAGVDFGGWVLTEKDDPDSQQALRYDQFIAPLTKALQETMAELEALKVKVNALEGN